MTEPTLADYGIVNRQTARNAGLRNAPMKRGLAVPKARKKPKRKKKGY